MFPGKASPDFAFQPSWQKSWWEAVEAVAEPAWNTIDGQSQSSSPHSFGLKQNFVKTTWQIEINIFENLPVVNTMKNHPAKLCGFFVAIMLAAKLHWFKYVSICVTKNDCMRMRHTNQTSEYAKPTATIAVPYLCHSYPLVVHTDSHLCFGLWLLSQCQGTSPSSRAGPSRYWKVGSCAAPTRSVTTSSPAKSLAQLKTQHAKNTATLQFAKHPGTISSSLKYQYPSGRRQNYLLQTARL